MNYIIHFDIAALLVSLSILISIIRNKTIMTRMLTAFISLIVLISLSSIFDVISIFMLKNPELSHKTCSWVINILYHICFLSIPVAFYYELHFSSDENIVVPVWNRILFDAPLIIGFVLLFSTPYTQLIFYFDNNGLYIRGALFKSLYVIALFYVGACVYKSSKNRNHFTSYQRFTVYCYIALCLTAVVIQYFYPYIMLMNFMMSVSAMIGYFALENPSDFKDKQMPVFNRNAFIQIMNQYFDTKKSVTILGLQLADFKQMVNVIGSKNRDKLLKQIAADFIKIAGKNNVFRVSQSRFAIILKETKESQNSQIKQFVEYVISPFKCGEMELLIGVKTQLIKCPDDASNVDDVLELFEHSFGRPISEADEIIPRANPAILVKKEREQKILETIKNAIAKKNFEVYYQPIYSVEKKAFTTAEALIRMKDSENKFVTPEEFIPLTEKTGLILEIGNFVFESVCKFIAETKIYEYGLEYIHVNLSVVQCMQENLHQQLLDIMERYGVDKKYIHLEVTESTAVASKEMFLMNMQKLSQHGVNFSLDDFGSGFSNTTSIINFPFKKIKLDKEMIWSAMRDKQAYTILEETISMVKDMNLEVVAEGVESSEQAELLRDLHCDYLQGFYFSLPLGRKRFEEVIKAKK